MSDEFGFNLHSPASNMSLQLPGCPPVCSVQGPTHFCVKEGRVQSGKPAAAVPINSPDTTLMSHPPTPLSVLQLTANHTHLHTFTQGLKLVFGFRESEDSCPTLHPLPSLEGPKSLERCQR